MSAPTNAAADSIHSIVLNKNEPETRYSRNQRECGIPSIDSTAPQLLHTQTRTSLRNLELNLFYLLFNVADIRNRQTSYSLI